MGRVWVGAEFFGSRPLYTGPNAGDTLVLTSTGSSYTVLGQAYLAANLSKTAQLIAGRTAAVDTPYANREFNRMTPNTFQGALLNGLIADEQQAHSLHYLVGYFDKIKERNSTNFISMSRAAGSDLSRGTALVGGRYSQQALSAGLIEYYTPDVLNVVYAGANYTPVLRHLTSSSCPRSSPTNARWPTPPAPHARTSGEWKPWGATAERC